MKRISIFSIALLLAISFVPFEGAKAQSRPATALTATSPSPVSLTLPNRKDTVKIAIFGYTGRGIKEQYYPGRMMNTYHIAFPYEMVLMTGSNIYGTD